MCGATWQKRKHSADDDDEFGLYPTWVSCMDSLVLFNKGVKPPADVKLSKEAAAEVRRVRAWAKEMNSLPIAEQLRQAEVDLPPPPPAAPTPPPVAMDAARAPFDPALLARVAQLKNAPRVG